jgi:hypothetical protein
MEWDIRGDTTSKTGFGSSYRTIFFEISRPPAIVGSVALSKDYNYRVPQWPPFAVASDLGSFIEIARFNNERHSGSESPLG